MKKTEETCTTPLYTVLRLYRRKRRSKKGPYYKWVDEDRSFTTPKEAERYIDTIHECLIGIKNYEPQNRFIIQKVENIKLITYDEE